MINIFQGAKSQEHFKWQTTKIRKPVQIPMQ